MTIFDWCPNEPNLGVDSSFNGTLFDVPNVGNNVLVDSR